MTSRPKMKCYVNSFSTVVFTESQYNKSKKLIKKKKKKKNIDVNTWTFVNFIKFSLEGLYLCF